MSPKPKSMACWQHGLPVGTATTVVVRFSDALRNSRCVGADVHTHAPGISAGPKPAVVALSSDMLRDSRCVGTDVHTHERGTYARRGNPYQARRVGAQVHTPERGACSPRVQGSSPCSLSNANNVNNASALRSCITYSAPLPRASEPARSLPSWRCLRICYETQGV